MRIQSVTIRNYRIHRECSVDFDDSRTLVGGPNESGKSTLVEAIHRALFLKARGNTANHRAMTASMHGGHAEVEVRFEAKGAVHSLRKRFGSSGTTTLLTTGSQALSGDEAESELARLLGVETGLSGNAAIGQWAHLWIWQRTGGDDPLVHADSQQSNLLKRLQESGGAAAMQSELDTRIAGQFAEARDAIFTQAGIAKAGSNLKKAEDADVAARERLERAIARVEASERNVRDFEESTRAISSAAANLASLERQRTEVEAKLARVKDLRLQEASRVPIATAAGAAHEAAVKTNAQIAALRGRIEASKAALAPGNGRTATLEAALEDAGKRVAEAARAQDAALTNARASRQRRDLAAAWVARFEREERLRELSITEEKVRARRVEMIALREELAKMPAIAEPEMKRLRKLEAAIGESQAALNAMAAGIEVLAAEEPVRVGDATLETGRSHIVTERTEIVVGDRLRLRITPGGGTGLREANERAAEARRKLDEALDGFGIGNVLEAAEIQARRNDLAGKIRNAEAALGDFDDEGHDANLVAAREAVAASVAEVERRAAQIEPGPAPENVAEAKRAHADEEAEVEKSESAENEARSIWKAATQATSASEETLSRHRQTLDGQNAQLAEATAQLQWLVQAHGDDATRATAIAETHAAKCAAESLLATTQRELAELQPDSLDADMARFRRAIDEVGKSRRDAETARAVAQAALRSDGTEDPQADLALAQAAADSAREHLDGVRRKAEAIRLLDRLFVEERRALAEKFTEPFAIRISAYLRCLFGDGARATVTLEENGFEGLQLVRPSEGEGAMPFDALSGGAREQVAAAVRLAMAEVLAPDHDGCLPIVFDDAFAYSDPERVQTLQRMLDLAATRGLQIIVLTCAPSDYAALGAKQVSLRCE